MTATDIVNSTNSGDIVLDPFMGIGGAGVSATNLNRDFIGIELDGNYFEIAKTRILGNVEQPKTGCFFDIKLYFYAKESEQNDT